MTDTKPTLADVITDALLKMKRDLTLKGEQMMRHHVRDVVAAQLATVPKVAPRRKPYNEMTEDEWIAFLENEPTLAGLDIKKEIGRCQFWCTANRATVTRKRILTWLRKAERDVAFRGAGQSSKPVTLQGNGIAEPAGWRAWLNANRPESRYADGNEAAGLRWELLDVAVRKYIAAEMAKPE